MLPGKAAFSAYILGFALGRLSVETLKKLFHAPVPFLLFQAFGIGEIMPPFCGNFHLFLSGDGDLCS